jgi:hypothetical protein
MYLRRSYLQTPTAAKLHIINEHEAFITTSSTELNVHSQRIISTFKIQIGYESCMDTLIKRFPLHTNEMQPTHATKPEGNTGTEPKLNNLEGEQPTFSPRDRDVPTDPPLVGGSVFDLAGQASAVDVDLALQTANNFATTRNDNLLVDELPTSAVTHKSNDELTESKLVMERNYALTSIALATTRNDNLLVDELPTSAITHKSNDELTESKLAMECNYALTSIALAIMHHKQSRRR